MGRKERRTSFVARAEELKEAEDETKPKESSAEQVEKELQAEVEGAIAKKMEVPKSVILCSALLGFLQLYYKIEHERERRADEMFQNPRPEIYGLVSSLSFEVMVAGLIFLNCAVLGWESSVPEGEYALLFDICEHFFVAAFLGEWTLRVLAFGWVWVFDLVNAADTCMVFLFGVLPKWVLPHIGVDADFVRIFTVLRALRLSRLARAVRFRPAFKELWILIHGLTTSFRPLLWTMTIALVLLFLTGLIATELIGKRSDFQDDEYVQELFGDLLKSAYTLFQLMTLDTWADTIARPVIDVDFNLSLFFVGFIGIGVFVFWNLITAIVVENAFAIAGADTTSQVKEAEAKKREELHSLAELFLEIDVDGSGELTGDEFFGALKNSKVKQMLELLEIQPAELEEVWNVLDDGDGFLTIKEFTTGLRRMRGQAKAKDMADTIKRLRHAQNATAELQAQADQFVKSLVVVEDEVARIAEDTGRMVGLFHEIYHRLNATTKINEKDDARRERERVQEKKVRDQQELEDAYNRGDIKLAALENLPAENAAASEPVP